jgi:patatin-like phospholipase/acyl hydrolase
VRPHVRILAIDGGGIRGLIPAVVLADLERRTGRRTAELFDLIAGTSTGGILACGLTRPGDGGAPAFTAADLIGLYESEGPEIFHRSLIKRIESVEGYADERYDDRGLNAALSRYLDGTRLSQAVTDLFITAYEIERREAFFFRSSRARTDPTYDFTFVDAARATSAAPTYFEPARVSDVAGADSYALIDGGVFALNPAMCAYAELAATGRRDEIDLVVSLGTGSHTRRLPFEDVRNWGQLEWARPLVDVVFDGGAQTVDFELGQLLGPERYVRLQTRLTEASDSLDDAGDRNLEALRREGNRLVEERAADLERIAGALAPAGS